MGKKKRKENHSQKGKHEGTRVPMQGALRMLDIMYNKMSYLQGIQKTITKIKRAFYKNIKAITKI